MDAKWEASISRWSKTSATSPGALSTSCGEQRGASWIPSPAVFEILEKGRPLSRAASPAKRLLPAGTPNYCAPAEVVADSFFDTAPPPSVPKDEQIIPVQGPWRNSKRCSARRRQSFGNTLTTL